MHLNDRVRKWVFGTLTLIVLGAVFMLYLQPEMLRTLADQVWACF